MKTLNERVREGIERVAFPDDDHRDVSEIVSFSAEFDVLISNQEAMLLWNKYSDMYAAGWLGVTRDCVEDMLNWVASKASD